LQELRKCSDAKEVINLNDLETWRIKEIKGDRQYPVIALSRELNILGWKRGDRVKVGIRKGKDGMEIVIRKISD